MLLSNFLWFVNWPSSRSSQGFWSTTYWFWMVNSILNTQLGWLDESTSFILEFDFKRLPVSSHGPVSNRKMATKRKRKAKVRYQGLFNEGSSRKTATKMKRKAKVPCHGLSSEGSNGKMATKMKRKAKVRYHGLFNEGSSRKTETKMKRKAKVPCHGLSSEGSNGKMATKMKRKAKVRYHGLFDGGSSRKTATKIQRKAKVRYHGLSNEASTRKMATEMKRKAKVRYHGLSNEGSNRKMAWECLGQGVSGAGPTLWRERGWRGLNGSSARLALAAKSKNTGGALCFVGSCVVVWFAMLLFLCV